MSKKCWKCHVGPVPANLPDGSDFPMRRAVKAAYFEVTGREPEYLFSGWNEDLTPGEEHFLGGPAPQEDLRSECARLRGALEGLSTALDALIEESYGVSGLHLNGDDAPWGDLIEGGRFEEWLGPARLAARAALSPRRGEEPQP